jgi:hypothetical protein
VQRDDASGFVELSLRTEDLSLDAQSVYLVLCWKRLGLSLHSRHHGRLSAILPWISLWLNVYRCALDAAYEDCLVRSLEVPNPTFSFHFCPFFLSAPSRVRGASIFVHKDYIRLAVLLRSLYRCRRVI